MTISILLKKKESLLERKGSISEISRLMLRLCRLKSIEKFKYFWNLRKKLIDLLEKSVNLNKWVGLLENRIAMMSNCFRDYLLMILEESYSEDFQ